MDPRDALTEAWRNLVGGTARALIVTAALLGATLLIVGLDLSSVVDLVQRAHAFQDAGAATLILHADGRIDATRCQDLNSLANTTCAAITPRQRQVRAAQLPQHDIDVAQATPSLAGILHIHPSGAGIWVASALATDLGVQAGSTLNLDGQPTRVAAIYPYPDDGRQPGLGYAIIEPVPARGTFDEGWLLRWPLNPTANTLLLSTTRPGSTTDAASGETTWTQLNTTLGADFDPTRLLHNRPTALLLWIAPLLGFLISFTALRLRRLEFASARHAGVTTAPLWLIASTETAACLIVSWLLAAPVTAWLLHPLSPADATACLPFALRPTLLIAAGALLGTTTAVLAAREENLFDYFKGR